jgi:hypothetical protein
MVRRFLKINGRDGISRRILDINLSGVAMATVVIVDALREIITKRSKLKD